MKMPAYLRTIFLTFIIIIISGCLGGASESKHDDYFTYPWVDNYSEGEPYKKAINLYMPPEQVVYKYKTEVRTAIPLTISLSANSSKFLSLVFEHEGWKDFDYTASIELKEDGSREKAFVSCGPRYPDSRNKGGCFNHLGGADLNDGTHGAFFGVSLISGIDPDSKGVVTRSLNTGLRNFTASFQLIEASPEIVQIVSLDNLTKSLHKWRAEHLFGAGECSIINGAVLFSTKLGVPISCHYIPAANNSDILSNMAGYDIIKPPSNKSNRFKATNYVFDENPLTPSEGRILPPKEDVLNMPFGFYEALKYADKNNIDVRNFLNLEKYHLLYSLLSLSGHNSFGDCDTICYSLETWTWVIKLQGIDEEISINVRKTITSPSNSADYEVSRVELSETRFTYPEEVGIFPQELGKYWQKAYSITNNTPTTIETPSVHLGENGEILDYKIITTFCCPSGGSGYPPFMTFDRAGNIIENYSESGGN